MSTQMTRFVFLESSKRILVTRLTQKTTDSHTHNERDKERHTQEPDLGDLLSNSQYNTIDALLDKLCLPNRSYPFASVQVVVFTQYAVSSRSEGGGDRRTGK
jgi:hypothetical protein